MRTSREIYNDLDIACLESLEPFTDSDGSLTAFVGAIFPEDPSGLGTPNGMPEEWLTGYEADFAHPGIVYTVVSHNIPIAWVRADLVLVVPQVTYKNFNVGTHQQIAFVYMPRVNGFISQTPNRRD
jgi:hypothetical protein